MSRLGVALVGCAHTTHAWSYARALSSSPTARLVGVYDDDPRLAEPIVRDFGVERYADAAELLGTAGVDAVVVCSPTSEHRRLVELAASLGRPVLCEKPIATTMADGAAMVAACRDAGVLLQLAFVSRFHPLVRRVREAVLSEDLGDVIGMVGANRGRPPLPPTYPDWITSVEQAGGGALIDHSVHVTDVMRHVSGSEVVRVSAEVGAQLWDCGVDDVALMSLVFDSGAVASVDPSWSVPEGNPWDYDFSLRVVGTKASFDLNDLPESVQLVSRRWGGGLRLAAIGEDLDALMIENFVASVEAGETLDPGANGEDGLRALEVALAGYASAYRHHPVDLPL